jgi:hypothetical protein
LSTGAGSRPVLLTGAYALRDPDARSLSGIYQKILNIDYASMPSR